MLATNKEGVWNAKKGKYPEIGCQQLFALSIKEKKKRKGKKKEERTKTENDEMKYRMIQSRQVFQVCNHSGVICLLAWLATATIVFH